MNAKKLVLQNGIKTPQHKNYLPYKWKSWSKRESNYKSALYSSLTSEPNAPTKVNRNCLNGNLPQIAIKRKDNDSPGSMNTEVVLLNGSWDTSNKIPNIIAEMHNVNIEELRVLQNTCPNKQLEIFSKHNCTEYAVPSPKGSDSGIEVDYSDGNLSWLLNYKIHELPPVPDISGEQQNNLQGGAFDESSSQKISQVNVARIISDKSNGQIKEDPLKLPGHSYRYSGPKKPPFTYTELIEHALSEKGELTVSGIYQWISDHFPFYKQNDDRWKNSVRHNLSINPHFRKGNKAVHGAGHLWTIAQRDDKKTWHIKKQRMQQFMQTAYNDWSRDKQLELELATATASILPENTDGEMHRNEMLNHQNGMKRHQSIEVEYVNVIDVTNGLEDFLCPPVSKQQMVEECGLSEDYLITDLNPASLGLNLAEAEIITGGNLYDDLNFQCYELQTE